VSQPDPTPAAPQETTLADAQAQYKQHFKAFGKVIDRITPWLVEFGSWLFGGLIAFILVVVASLITVGPVDPAITTATAVFSFALPLYVSGLFLLRLVQDQKHIGLEVEVAQALQEVGLSSEDYFAVAKDREPHQKRKTAVVLGYALGMLVLSALLTLTGMTAALWHVAWWIGVSYCAMAFISVCIVLAALNTLAPARSPEKQAQRKRAMQEIIRQAKASPQNPEEPEQGKMG
jgi:hypothetical protein